MNLWQQSDFDALTPAEQRAVTSRVPQAQAGEQQMSTVDYLNSIGAGTSAIASYVEEDKAANRTAMTSVADAMFEAGIPPSLLAPLGLAFVAATPDVRLQIQSLLAPKG